MSYFQLIDHKNIPASIQGIWDFIFSPINLKEITPDYMRFDITKAIYLKKCIRV